MIDTKALKNKILDLAISGKLTEQLPEDGNAEDLYTLIQEEKTKLIAEGKIKKDRPTPSISKDEIPFEIPANWKWVRLCDVYNIVMGQSPDGSSVSTDENGIEFHQGKIYFGQKYLEKSRFTTSEPSKIALRNSVLLCVRAPVGVANITDREICIGRGLCAFHDFIGIQALYSFYAISSLKHVFEMQSKGSTFAAITADIVKKQIIPLPPMAEQKRIVSAVEDTFSIIDKIEKAQESYYADQEVLKNKIVEAGIRGKLTEQLPEDGNAEDLYTQIQEEKERLVAEGKIKKEKPLPLITEDEIPFEIPANWKWVRIGDVFKLQAGKNIKASLINAKKSDEYRYCCFGGNGVRGYVRQYNEEKKHVLIGRQGALCGNINVADGYFYATEHAVVVDQFDKTSVEWASHALRYLNLNQYATSVAQPGLAVGTINKVLIPLPPFAEQERIVGKIELTLNSIIKM